MVNFIVQTAVVEELDNAHVSEPNIRNVDDTSVIVIDPTATQASVLLDLEKFSTEHQQQMREHLSFDVEAILPFAADIVSLTSVTPSLAMLTEPEHIDDPSSAMVLCSKHQVIPPICSLIMLIASHISKSACKHNLLQLKIKLLCKLSLKISNRVLIA